MKSFIIILYGVFLLFVGCFEENKRTDIVVNLDVTDLVFGAVPNDSKRDDEAINMALGVAQSIIRNNENVGVAILFPPGEYNMEGNVYSEPGKKPILKLLEEKNCAFFHISGDSLTISGLRMERGE